MSCSYATTVASNTVSISESFFDTSCSLLGDPGTVHEMAWHAGETCKAYDRRMNGRPKVEEGEIFDYHTASTLGIDIPEYTSRSSQNGGSSRRPPRSTVSAVSAGYNHRDKKKRHGLIHRLVSGVLDTIAPPRPRSASPELDWWDTPSPARRYSPDPRPSSQTQQQREQQRRQQREDSERREHQERLKRKAEERLGEAMVKTVAKQCPSCSWYIQKSSGCGESWPFSSLPIELTVANIASFTQII